MPAQYDQAEKDDGQRNVDKESSPQHLEVATGSGNGIAPAQPECGSLHRRHGSQGHNQGVELDLADQNSVQESNGGSCQ